MRAAQKSAYSRRMTTLSKKFRSKAYRDSYVSTHLRTFLSHQIRALRGDMTQAEFGALLGKPQNVVSRLENPSYGKLTLQTLLDVADKTDVALLVRFIDFQTFLEVTGDLSDRAVHPESYDEKELEDFAQSAQMRQSFPSAFPIATTALDLTTNSIVNYVEGASLSKRFWVASYGLNAGSLYPTLPSLSQFEEDSFSFIGSSALLNRGVDSLSFGFANAPVQPLPGAQIQHNPAASSGPFLAGQEIAA